MIRYETPTGKTYRPFHKDGATWTEGCVSGSRPLYRLPELLASSGRVYVVEGEKAADAAAALGLTATTSMHGAKSPGKTDWQPLAGRDVVILPDADDAGDRFARTVADILIGLSPPARPRTTTLPGVGEHGDIVDFIAAKRGVGSNDDAILALVEELADAAAAHRTGEPATRPILTPLHEVEPAETEWLWEGRIPLGKLTMIAGDPGLGKSFLTLDMAARVSTGTPWPDQLTLSVALGGVLIINIEDDNADTVVPRLDAAGADRTRIVAFNSIEAVGKVSTRERLLSLDTDMPWLEEAIRSVPDLRLVIIDPVSAFLGKADSNNNAEVRGLLAPLAELAAKYRVAIVCVSHLNKNSGGSAIYRTIGSIGQVAAARAAYGVVRDKSDRSRRLFVPMKNNLGPDESGLAYRIAGGDEGKAAHVEWEPEPIAVSADEALGDGRTEGAGSAERSDAEDFLRDLLSDGPLPAQDVFKAARDNGISRSMVKKAKTAIGVRSVKRGFADGAHWVWRLPGNESLGADDVPTVEGSNTGPAAQPAAAACVE